MTYKTSAHNPKGTKGSTHLDCQPLELYVSITLVCSIASSIPGP